MKILAITVCYNEKKLAPFFLKHYSSICDKIIVYDNMSTDGTPEILSKDNKVEIIQFDTGNEFNNLKHSNIKNNEWKKYKDKYDWIICIDFDEFLYHPDLISTLKHFKNENISIPSVIGFNMKSFDFPIFDGKSIVDKVPYGKFDRNFTKNLIFDPKKIEEINYADGCHFCSPVGEIKYSDNPVYLFHYKKLGYTYESEKLRSYIKKRYMIFENNKCSENKGCYSGLLSKLEKKYEKNEKRFKEENLLVTNAIREKKYDKKIKNVIISVCDYKYETIVPYITSFLKNIKQTEHLTDLVIFTNNITMNERLNISNISDGRIRCINIDIPKNSHINAYRYYIYSDFLKNCYNRYDYVFLTDIRDVLFMTNALFNDIENKKIVKVYSEEKFKYPSKEVNDWENKCYNLLFKENTTEYKELSTTEYFCSGTILGSKNELLDFCEKMCFYMDKFNDGKNSKDFCFETGVFNYIIKILKPDYIKCCDNSSDEVLMFSRFRFFPLPFKKDENGNLLNSEGVPFSILHFNGMPKIPEEYLQQIGLSRNKVYNNNSVKSSPNKTIIQPTMNFRNPHAIYNMPKKLLRPLNNSRMFRNK